MDKVVEATRLCRNNLLHIEGIYPYMLVLHLLVQQQYNVCLLSKHFLWETHEHLMSVLLQQQIFLFLN